MKYSIVLFIVHVIFLMTSGYFSIGLLSDDYMNFISAQSSTLEEKFTSSIPYYSNLHFRPLWFLSIDLSIFLNRIFTSSIDNFIFFRIENLLWFYILLFISGNFLFKITSNRIISLAFVWGCLIFPNNINNICWTAGKVDIICAVFFISALSTTFNYITKKKNIYLLFTLLLFLSALLTKETAVTFPFISLLFFTMIIGKEVLANIKTLIISETAILFGYIFYKIFSLKNLPADVVSAFQEPGISESLSVIIRALISLIIPFDYLTLQNRLNNYDYFIIIYLLIIFTFLVLLIYLFVKNRELRSVVSISGLFLIMISPNLIAGYFRPQLILIPFITISLSVFFVFNKVKNINGIIKLIVSVVFLFWLMISFNLIKDWKYASEVTEADAGSMCRENFDFKNKVYVIGLPSRYNQAFIMNYVSGQYNYYCNKEFKLTNNVSDIIHTGALDKISLNSELRFKLISDNEFEVRTTGETQYLLKLDNTKNEFSDENLELIFSEYNSFNKPTKAKIKMLNNSGDVYLFSKEKFSMLNLKK